MRCDGTIRTLVLLLCAMGLVAGQLHSGATQDETAVRSLVRGLEDAWNHHDMDAFARPFADDADFVNVIGARWIGRPAIKEAHQASHATIFKNSHLRVGETSVRFLTPDVAVARSLWNLEGHTNPTGEPQPPRTGILTHVLLKQQDGWHIVVTQNTDIVVPK
jgi:uncharacterized protein (TIGR02246 family)